MAFPPAYRISPRIFPPKNPEDLLPPQLWMTIFNKCQDSKDLKACSETCRAFKTLLEKRKQYWSFELLLPQILRRLDHHSALNCRLVCRDWQEALDRFAEDSPNNVPYQEDFDNHPFTHPDSLVDPEIAKLCEPLNLRDSNNLKELMAKNEKTPMQDYRLIGGSVIIGPVGSPKDGYLNDAWGCLRTFGPRIRSLELHNPGNGPYSSYDILHVSLHMALRHCGNLRKLQLEDSISQPLMPNDVGTNMIKETYPLPELVQLESLLFGAGVPRQVQTAMLERYGVRLKWLECTLCGDVGRNTLQSLKNLTQMLVRIKNEGTLQDNPGNEESIRRILLIPAEHLQKLSIELMDKVNLELATLLEICRRFPSLKALAVSGNVRTIVDGELPTGSRRMIRSVKSLEFLDVKGVKSFDFLECFPSLERLHLKGIYPTNTCMKYGRPAKVQRLHYGVRSDDPETVQIRKFLYPEDEADYVKMYESNLWVICPRLKRFMYEYEWTGGWTGPNNGTGLKEETVRTCTREELWEFYGF